MEKMKKQRNYLFLNVILFYLFAFIGFIIYSNNVEVDGVLLSNTSSMNDLLMWFIISAIAPLALSYFYGEKIKKGDYKAYYIAIVLVVMFVIASLFQFLNTYTLISGLSGMYVDDYATYNYAFYESAIIGLILFYYIIITIKFIRMLVENEEFPSKKTNLVNFKKIFELAAISSVGAGVLACSFAFFSKLVLNINSSLIILLLGHELSYTFGENFSAIGIIFFVLFAIIYGVVNYVVAKKSRGYFFIVVTYLAFAICSFGGTTVINQLFSMTFYYLNFFYIMAMGSILLIFLVTFAIRFVRGRIRAMDEKKFKLLNDNEKKTTETKHEFTEEDLEKEEALKYYRAQKLAYQKQQQKQVESQNRYFDDRYIESKQYKQNDEELRGRYEQPKTKYEETKNVYEDVNVVNQNETVVEDANVVEDVVIDYSKNNDLEALKDELESNIVEIKAAKKIKLDSPEIKKYKETLAKKNNAMQKRIIELEDIEKKNEVKEDVIILEKELANTKKELHTAQKKLNANSSEVVTYIDSLKVKIDELSEKIKESEANGNLAKAPRYEKEIVTILKRSFKSKLILADDSLKELYNNMLNLINKYKKVRVRHAFAKDTIYVGRKTIAIIKMSSTSKKMYIYFALDKETYLNSKYRLKDYSDKPTYEQTPLRLSVRSNRSIGYALVLLENAISELNCDKYANDRPTVDYISDLHLMSEEDMIKQGLIKKQVIEETYLVKTEGNKVSKVNVDPNDDDLDDELDDDDDEEDDSDINSLVNGNNDNKEEIKAFSRKRK